MATRAGDKAKRDETSFVRLKETLCKWINCTTIVPCMKSNICVAKDWILLANCTSRRLRAIVDESLP